MSEKIDKGGPAFPTSLIQTYDGMTLLDYFAGQALAGMLAYSNASRGNWTENCAIDGVAGDAYRYAEAMIAEKRRRREQS